MSETRGKGSDSGVYIAVFHLTRPRRISVGRLGRFSFPVGFYFYVGRARRGLKARLTRHGRSDKPQQWHIDYLSTRAEMLGAIEADCARYGECDLADELAEMYPRFIAGFGSSDCRCGGHLFYSPTLTAENSDR